MKPAETADRADFPPFLSSPIRHLASPRVRRRVLARCVPRGTIPFIPWEMATLPKGPRPLGEPPVRTSVTFDADDHAEIAAEAKRTDRGVSWVMQRAWKISRGRIREEQP